MLRVVMLPCCFVGLNPRQRHTEMLKCAAKSLDAETQTEEEEKTRARLAIVSAKKAKAEDREEELRAALKLGQCAGLEAWELFLCERALASTRLEKAVQEATSQEKADREEEERMKARVSSLEETAQQAQLRWMLSFFLFKDSHYKTQLKVEEARMLLRATQLMHQTSSDRLEATKAELQHLERADEKEVAAVTAWLDGMAAPAEETVWLEDADNLAFSM